MDVCLLIESENWPVSSDGLASSVHAIPLHSRMASDHRDTDTIRTNYVPISSGRCEQEVSSSSGQASACIKAVVNVTAAN